jgi:hypothetical protein
MGHISLCLGGKGFPLGIIIFDQIEEGYGEKMENH